MIADQAGIEDRLRGAFADAAGNVREDELRYGVPLPPRRRSQARGRRRLVLSAAAAGAVLAVVAGAIVAPRILHIGSRTIVSHPEHHARITPLRPVPLPPSTAPTAYVVTFTGTVVRINLATGAVLKPTIKLPAGYPGPDAVAISANGEVICVLTNGHSRAHLTTINALTGAVAPPIALDILTPENQTLAITPDGRTAYVAVEGSPAEASGVIPVNLVTGSAGRKIKIPNAGQMAITPNGRTLYVSSNRPAPKRSTYPQVVAIDTATNTVLKVIKIPTLGDAWNTAVSPNGQIVYVLTQRPPHRGSAVTPISVASNTASRPIPIQPQPGQSAQLAVAPDGQTAYVSSGIPYVTPINLRTDQALPAIRLRRPRDSITFQIAPDGRTAYVYGQLPPKVIPFDLATETQRTAIVVTRRPYTEISTYNSPLGFDSGYLYAGIATSSWTPPQRVGGALSEVQLATGRIKIIKINGLPQELLIAP